MPTGLNNLWATRNVKIRNLEFLYETSFEYMYIYVYIYIITYIICMYQVLGDSGALAMLHSFLSNQQPSQEDLRQLPLDVFEALEWALALAWAWTIWMPVAHRCRSAKSSWIACSICSILQQCLRAFVTPFCVDGRSECVALNRIPNRPSGEACQVSCVIGIIMITLFLSGVDLEGFPFRSRRVAKHWITRKN